MRRSNISKLDRKMKLSLPVLILIIVLALSVSTTVAFLIASTTPIENSFTPGKVTSAVQETFDGTMESLVKLYRENQITYEEFIKLPEVEILRIIDKSKYLHISKERFFQLMDL